MCRGLWHPTFALPSRDGRPQGEQRVLRSQGDAGGIWVRLGCNVSHVQSLSFPSLDARTGKHEECWEMAVEEPQCSWMGWVWLLLYPALFPRIGLEFLRGHQGFCCPFTLQECWWHRWQPAVVMDASCQCPVQCPGQVPGSGYPPGSHSAPRSTPELCPPLAGSDLDGNAGRMLEQQRMLGSAWLWAGSPQQPTCPSQSRGASVQPLSAGLLPAVPAAPPWPCARPPSPASIRERHSPLGTGAAGEGQGQGQLNLELHTPGSIALGLASPPCPAWQPGAVWSHARG